MTGHKRERFPAVFWILTLLMLICVWGNFNGYAAAPDAPDDAEVADEAADGENVEERDAKTDEKQDDDGKAENLGQLIVKSSGNWVAIGFYSVLLLFSLVAMVVALGRLVALRRARVVPPRFVRELNALLASKQGDIENLGSLCDGSGSPIAKVLKAGVLRSGRPLPEIEKAMEDTVARESAAMQSRNRPLAVIGNVAPLVGLLGTVVGMILAFHRTSTQGTGKGEQLAEGIYLALITTAMGLTIAIPCLLLVAWFNTKVERFMRDIDETLLETMPSFTRIENAVAGDGSPAAE
ncbi:MAG: MotA/TolQ/ExbB proton channel family protein [Candidatus Nealsonbacteria bacterium]|nr:MotA/TolQ/ExbB proton channel family protein [Candidatus Nealsonbacteria bacterium]